MSRKGKTYEEIYGERADEERIKRSNRGVIVKAFRTKWCGCGCGGQFKEDSRYPRQFIRGHNARVNHGMTGKHHSEESNQKNCETHLGKSPNHKPNCGCGICRAKRGELKGLTKEIDPRVAKQAESLKRTWQNPEYREKQLDAIFKGLKLLPNKPEKFITKLLNTLLPGEWKYTGAGKEKKYRIGGRAPDFTNIDGQKKLIEFFGDFTHGPERTGRTNAEEERQKIAHYAKYNYQTLIIWEHELKYAEGLREKVLKFNRIKS